jgi:hypothetical protein
MRYTHLGLEVSGALLEAAGSPWMERPAVVGSPWMVRVAGQTRTSSAGAQLFQLFAFFSSFQFFHRPYLMLTMDVLDSFQFFYNPGPPDHEAAAVRWLLN